MCLAQGPQRSDAIEARTRGPSVSSQALNHWATALPISNDNGSWYADTVQKRTFFMHKRVFILCLLIYLEIFQMRMVLDMQIQSRNASFFMHKIVIILCPLI